jgi:hypothetical protein
MSSSSSSEYDGYQSELYQTPTQKPRRIVAFCKTPTPTASTSTNKRRRSSEDSGEFEGQGASRDLEARVAALEKQVAEDKQLQLALTRRINLLEQTLASSTKEAAVGLVHLSKADFALIPEGKRKGVYNLFLTYMLKSFPDPVDWLGLQKGTSPAILANELLEGFPDDAWSSMLDEMKSELELIVDRNVLKSLFRKKTKEYISKPPSPESCAAILRSLGLEKTLHEGKKKKR